MLGEDERKITDDLAPDVKEIETASETVVSENAEAKEDQNALVVVQNIEEAAETPKPKQETLPKYALICIGEYPIKVLTEGQLPGQKDDVQLIFIDKSSEEIIKWSKDKITNSDLVMGLDANIETHFWFQILPYLTQNEDFSTRLKNKLLDNQFGILTLSSSWDGIGSALLPFLASRYKDWNANSVTTALLPSKLQPSEAHFNAMSSIGLVASKEAATLVLIGRDHLNKYVGVDRKGAVMKGNALLNCLADLTMAKKTFVDDLSQMSKSFGVKTFTIMAATGASLKIYGSLENILDSTLFRPLLSFDVSGVTLLYVLLRIPLQLKEKLSRDKIELEIANWFKDKAALKSIYVTEPLYVEDVSDRVDMIMFVGGFGLSSVFTSMEKKASTIKTEAVKQGSIKEEDWKEITKILTSG